MSQRKVGDLSIFLLAVVFSAGLFFAFIELPRLIDTVLQKYVGAPDIDQGRNAWEAFLSDVYISGLKLRWIGYGIFTVLVAFIIAGYASKKTPWALAGAIGIFLPVFGQFALAMFFLAGLGILRISWFPFMDVSPGVLCLGDSVYIPYRFLMWLFGWQAHYVLSYLFMGAGSLVFVWGVLAWLRTRAGNGSIAIGQIYRYSRHPQYLGWIVWSYGFMLYSSTMNTMKRSWDVPSSLPWLLMTMAIIGICLIEEMKMRDLAGYEDYRNRTPFLFPLPRWLGRILRFPVRVMLGKDRPEKKLEAVYVVLFYTAVFILLSLPWVSFKSTTAGDGSEILSVAPPDPRAYRDSLLAEIRKPQPRRTINVHFKAMERLGEDAVAPLIGLLEDTNGVVREFAAQSLGNLRDTSAIGPLMRASRDPLWRVRSTAVQSISRMGSEACLGPLLDILSGSPEAGFRIWIYEGLGMIGSEAPWDVLVSGLSDSLAFARAASLKALSRINPGRSGDLVIRALQDRDPHVRREAVFILMREKPGRAADALRGVLEDEDFDVRFYARQAIRMIEDAK